MDLQHHVFVGNQFGTQTVGNYILRYTSKEEKTETLGLSTYITSYTPRLEATETLLENGGDETIDDTFVSDMELERKDGVMFGNRGLSYSDETLKYAAKVSQKAANKGHVAVLPVISFTHEYLVEHGLVDKNMPKPNKDEDGIYSGKVDQLKLRMAITDMMERFHREMGYSKPEWTATIQFDTGNVHAHITSIETETPKNKRLKKVYLHKGDKVPDMAWKNRNREEKYSTHMNEDGLVEYHRNNEVIAEQKITKNNKPKWREITKHKQEMEWVETGKINEKIRTRMREHLTRSLDAKTDINPFVQEIDKQRQATKALTVNSMYYNEKTVQKIQALAASLPENKKMWRAKSNAKAMERPHELANEIVDDIWSKYHKGIGLDDFDRSTKEYSHIRQKEENLSDEKKESFEKQAYKDLRRETINEIYRSMKQFEDKDKDYVSNRINVQAAPTETLKNKIANDYYDENVNKVDQSITLEYKKRDYQNRYIDAYYNKNKFKKQIENYDQLEQNQQVSEDSKVVRNFYQKEYDYHQNRFDKYHYLTTGGKKTQQEKEQFQKVKGVDLVNMLYDYQKGDDRSIPKEIAEQYQQQTHDRKEAMNETLDYLVDTGQYEQYEILRDKRDAVRKEADISDQIKDELEIPLPEQKAYVSTIEDRKTIDTVQGRRLLKEEIREVSKITKDLNLDSYTSALPKEQEKQKDISVMKMTDNQSSIDYYKEKREQQQQERMLYSVYYKEEEEEEYNMELIEENDLDATFKENKDIELDL